MVNERINWIDWAKVLGIWLVIYGHTPGHLYGDIIFLFHMPLFFMLSGILYKQRPFFQEFKRSFISLIVPYLLYNLILVIIYRVSDLPITFCDIKNILLGNQEMLPDDFRPMWFIVSIFIIRCFLSLFKRVWIAGIISVILFIILKSFGIINYDNDYLQIGTSLLCTIFVVLGYYLHNNPSIDIINSIRLSKLSKILLILILIVPLIALGLFNYHNAVDITYGGINVFRCATGYSLLLFYIDATLLSYSFIKVCDLLFAKTSSGFVKTISSGTILLLCIHQIVVNAVSHLVGVNWLMAILLATFLVLVSFLLIKFLSKYCPELLGKKRNLS